MDRFNIESKPRRAAEIRMRKILFRKSKKNIWQKTETDTADSIIFEIRGNLRLDRYYNENNGHSVTPYQVPVVHPAIIRFPFLALRVRYLVTHR